MKWLQRLRLRRPGKKKPVSLASNITVTFVVVFAVALILLGVFILVNFRTFFVRRADEDIDRVLSMISPQGQLPSEEDARRASEEITCVVTLYEEKERPDNLEEEPSLLPAFPGDKKPYVETVFTVRSQTSPVYPSFQAYYNKHYDFIAVNVHFRSYIRPIEKDGVRYYLHVSRPLVWENTLYSLLNNTLLFGIIIALAASIVAGYLVSNRLLSPISAMAEKVRGISPSNMAMRLDNEHTRGELKDFAVSFDRMLDNISDAYEKQRRFVSDASHELRTPVAIIQGYADMLSRWGKEDKVVLNEAIDAISAQSSSMKALVEKLLFLTRAQGQGFSVEYKHFDFEELAAEIIEGLKMVRSTHRIVSRVEPGLIAYGDRELIRQLLVILLDNAVKYTPTSGVITLSGERRKDTVLLTVEDTGIGMAPEYLERIFDRFYRVDPSREKATGGFGLGLSIARHIVEAHGGTITAKSVLSKGTTIIVELPAGMG